MKYFILTCLVVFNCCAIKAQNLTVYLNNKKAATISVGEDPVVTNIKVKKYRNTSRLVLALDKQSMKSVYKRTLQVTDENENLLYQLTDSRSNAGVFKINLASLRKKLAGQKVLKVFLAEDPANDMMKLPSKRNYLAELHLK